MKKSKALKTIISIWTALITFLILLILIDAGAHVFFDGWSIINFIAFKHGGVANVFRGIASILGLIGLINLVIAQIMMILKKF